MSSTNQPQAKPGIKFRQESDEWVILFDPDTGNARTLNPVGVFVWKLLDGSNSLGIVVEKLRESYSNVPAEVDEHVKQFVEVLQKTGFVQPGEALPGAP
jgi:SynChlorMet cassette protein ScmD